MKVVYDGEAQNFHGVWDYGMINDYCNEDWQSFADEVFFFQNNNKKNVKLLR